MGEKTGIAWCDHTMNFWIGCTEVSAACDHCYAKAYGHRFGVEWGNHPRRRTSADNWRKARVWNAKATNRGDRPRVFTNSLADFFDNQVEPDWRNCAWEVIAHCRHMDWMILTKRPQNIARMLPQRGSIAVDKIAGPWPWSHVWLGTTVENQEEADRRIPHLLATPAAVRFLSCEPLLGPVDLTAIRRTSSEGFMRPLDGRFNRINLVIAGGESGPGKREMDLAWMRSLRDQCAGAGVPFFGKQWDKARPLPDDLMVRQFPEPRT